MASMQLLKVLAIAAAAWIAAAAQQQPLPHVDPTPEQKALIDSKVRAIGAIVAQCKASGADPDLLADVEVYAKAGQWLLEFPEDFFTPADIDHALAVLDTGLRRARQLQNGESPWTAERRVTHGFYSALDGSVQPYGIALPSSYDGTKPLRLYVSLHGRAARLTEASFLYAFPNQGPSKPPVADNGQIQLDVYGRWNGAGYHFAGEADVFEAIAAVEKRYKIDPERILLRGFSMGGEGAWHLALHYPDRWAAAEIGAGTWSRRPQMPGLTPYQYATLRIWENIPEWALNVFDLPLAAHDGDHDPQVSSLPPPPRGTPTRGQLESSLRAREQLEKEGFPSQGEPDFLRAQGTPAIFLISQNTGHGTSPLVRERLDAFLKEYGDRGRVSPDHIRFLTYTTRYNRDYWISLDGLEQHYERAEIDALRSDSGSRYRIATKNLTRLTLRETEHAREIRIDSQDLRVTPAPEIALDKSAGKWRVAHAQSGGIAQDPRAPRSHRRRLPRSLPPGAPHGKALERGRKPPNSANAGALRPAIREMVSRSSPRPGRQGRRRIGFRALQRGPVRRPRQQSLDFEDRRQAAAAMDAPERHRPRPEVPGGRQFSRADLSQPPQSIALRRRE